ncbi:MAG: response regulator [Candidatus Tectomicrobia bacterium]|nr:response regulator [Candidatus Tectomicrobia bacterium]
MARLLIVEDDRVTALALQRVVTRMGHTVVACVASAAEAMAAVQAYRPEVVLLDVSLTGPQDGLRVGLDIQTFWSTPVIYLSGWDPTELSLPEFPEALWCYVAKPIARDRLQDILARLFTAHPPRHGALGSEGQDTPHSIPRSRRAWTTEALRTQLRQLRQPAGALERSSSHRLTVAQDGSRHPGSDIH